MYRVVPPHTGRRRRPAPSSGSTVVGLLTAVRMAVTVTGVGAGCPPPDRRG